jgi:hypothetical protein
MTVAADAATQKADADKKAADDAAAATAAAAAATAAAEKKTADDAAAAAAAAAAQQAADDKGKAGEVEPPPKAPADYTLLVPDDRKHFVDDADLTLLKDLARKADWTNEDAQAALNDQLSVIQAQSDRYLAETKADKTYGGDKLDHTTRLAQQAIAKVRPEGHPRRDAFLRFMNRGGAGNHIEVLSFLADFGKLIAEDNPAHAGGGAERAKLPLADRLYGGKPAAKE